ncbi:hypothetical protein [Serratia sp. Se-RSBMAAmG]|uniref:hypothetical protein n=1 Tax=Serratia sp. Se-RSBMAAmG TaxID=3043305 RepID=UPI0024AF8EA1|nr:hypothetical protein [Serratia sp. Se-RSBMAAmG]MDI6975988.1 hypothetical protein [Serratia sp. Se-RSBMAAmG]
MTVWKRTVQEVPEENVIVRTISPGGEEADLYRIGNLWYAGTMYVYYTPERWAYY